MLIFWFLGREAHQNQKKKRVKRAKKLENIHVLFYNVTISPASDRVGFLLRLRLG